MRHLRTIAQISRAVSSQLRHVSTIGKMLNEYPRNMANFGPLTAEICWRVWGTPTNFNGFRALASLLQRRRSTEGNQSLHYIWPSAGLIHYIYILGALNFAPNGILSSAKFNLRSSLAFSYILAALLHGTRAVGVSHTLRHGTRNGITELSLLVIFN